MMSLNVNTAVTSGWSVSSRPERRSAAVGRLVRGDHQTGLDPVGRGGRGEPLVPDARLGPGVVVEHADPGVSLRDQVGDRGMDPRRAVDLDRAEPRALFPADEHHRHAARELLQFALGTAEVADDGVHLGADHLERAQFLLRPVAGVVHDDLPAPGPGRLQRGGGDLGEERVEQIGDHQPDGHRVLPDQTPGEPARPVTERASGVEHPLFGDAVDLVLVVQRP
jgi:hypothetical protein